MVLQDVNTWSLTQFSWTLIFTYLWETFNVILCCWENHPLSFGSDMIEWFWRNLTHLSLDIQIGGVRSSEGWATGQESFSHLRPSPLHPSPPPLLCTLPHTRNQTEEKSSESKRIISCQEQCNPSDLQARYPLVAPKRKSGPWLWTGWNPKMGQPEISKHSDHLPL